MSFKSTYPDIPRVVDVQDLTGPIDAGVSGDQRRSQKFEERLGAPQIVVFPKA